MARQVLVRRFDGQTTQTLPTGEYIPTMKNSRLRSNGYLRGLLSEWALKSQQLQGTSKLMSGFDSLRPLQ
jgi:hypothetical protein